MIDNKQKPLNFSHYTKKEDFKELRRLKSKLIRKWWNDTPDVCWYCGSTIEEYIKIRDFILSYNGTNFLINRFKRMFTWSKRIIKCSRMTIDRIENDRGYEPGNIVKACWVCNSLKGCFFTAHEMSFIIPKIITELKFNIQIENEYKNLV